MIKVNEYFNGTVKSLTYTTSEGNATVGVMEEGEYEFGTSSHETMVVVEGQLSVLFTGQHDWKMYGKGESFEVPANVSFKVRAKGQTSYLCKYR